MTNTILGLRTAVYYTSDMEKAKEWYITILGIQPYFDEPYYVGFNVGGFELGLHPAEDIHVDAFKSMAVYWGVEDINATYDILLKAGAKEMYAPQGVGGDIITATVIDPWGNPFGIIYNPHFGKSE